MDKEQLASYITEELSRGKQKNEIISELKVEGWQQSDIDEAFQSVENPQKSSSAMEAAAPDAAGSSSIPESDSSRQTSGETPPTLPPAGFFSHHRMFLIIGILFLVLGSGAIFLVLTRSTPKQPPIPPTPTIAATPTAEIAPSSSPALAPEVTDCGQSTRISTDEEPQPADVCIEEKFRSCLPAVYSPAPETLPTDEQVIRRQEILGKRGNYCLVKFTILQHAQPAWIGKDMTCKLDNARDFFSASRSTQFCSGPLYDLMQQGE